MADLRPTATQDNPYINHDTRMVETEHDGRLYITFGTTDRDEALRLVRERVEAGVLGFRVESGDE